jgi:hypothetical protein
MSDEIEITIELVDTKEGSTTKYSLEEYLQFLTGHMKEIAERMIALREDVDNLSFIVLNKDKLG